MAQTRTKDWRTGNASRQGRPNRSAGRPQTGRRFTRNTPQTAQTPRVGRPRRRQPQPSGIQGLVQSLKGSLPGGSGKRGKGSSLAGMGGLLSSLGGKKSGGGRKSAMLGLLGAGAAGAAVVAKRRKGSDASDTPATPAHLSADSNTAPATPVDGPSEPRPNQEPKAEDV